jgi:hypothetical protein
MEQKTLTRKQLYKLAWQKPMMHIAKEFGFSDRGLGKLCAKYEIPVPPRGYWMRLKAGQKIKIPVLKKIDWCSDDKVIVDSKSPEPKNTELSNKIKQEKDNLQSIVFDQKAQKYHPLVKSWNDVDKLNKYIKIDVRARKVLSLILFELESRGYAINQSNEDNRRTAKVSLNEDYVTVIVRKYSKAYKRKVQPSDEWEWRWRKSDNDLIYVTEETPYLKVSVWGTYSWSSWECKETENSTIEQTIAKSILYIIKKIDKLKVERLEKERHEKIRECKQRQIQTYNNFIKEQENIRQEYIQYENYKRQKLLEDSKKWKELCAVKEFLDYIKSNNDSSDNEWLAWAYSYLEDINPSNNKYFRSYDNYKKDN